MLAACASSPENEQLVLQACVVLGKLENPGGVVPPIQDLVDRTNYSGHRFLLSEALHQSGRLEDAERALREARSDANSRRIFDYLAAAQAPRGPERMRFYRCAREQGFADKDVLEVGGQLPGRFVRAARPHSWTCVDLNATDGVEGTDYRRIGADAADMPLRDESVDIVFSSSAFEHLRDLHGSMREMTRVLRPGGVLYSDFGPIWSGSDGHHLRGPAREALKRAGVWPLAPWSHLLKTRGEMKAFLRENLEDEHEVRLVERWLYRRESLNRVFFEDYVHAFYNSGLRVLRVDLKEGPEPDEAQLEILRRRHPGRTSFHVRGFRVVLKK